MDEAETISRAMSILGSRTSEAKAKAARANGKLGGAPKLTAEERRERKLAKRAAMKRPTHSDKKLPWTPVYNSANGPRKSDKDRPYRGKSERRQVISERRARRKAGRQA